MFSYILKWKEKDIIKIKKIYNGLMDIIFQQTFCLNDSKKILKKFLEDVLDMKINHLEIMTPVLPIQTVKEWRKVTDLLVKADNVIINTELNQFYYKGLNYRNYAYISSVYSKYMKRGMPIDEMPKFIQLNLNTNLPKYYKYPDYEYEAYSKEREDYYVDNIKIITYNVDKIVEKYYNKDNQEVLENAPRYAKYLTMLKLAGKELEEYCKGGDEVMTEYVKRVTELTSDEIATIWMDPETEEKMIRETIRNEAFDDGERYGYETGKIAGEKKGQAQGKLEMAIDTAKKLLKSGIDEKIITNATGLSKQEIDDLKLVIYH